MLMQCCAVFGAMIADHSSGTGVQRVWHLGSVGLEDWCPVGWVRAWAGRLEHLRRECWRLIGSVLVPRMSDSWGLYCRLDQCRWSMLQGCWACCWGAWVALDVHCTGHRCAVGWQDGCRSVLQCCEDASVEVGISR